MRLSKVFTLVLCAVSFVSLVSGQALAQTQADDVHFISSELGGKETIKVTKIESNGTYLLDRCDAQRLHCAPLVQGHEVISLKELDKQELSGDIKPGAKDAVGILVTALIGTAIGGPFGAGFALAAGGTFALKGAGLAYNERQMESVNEPGNSNDDLRVFDIRGYDKALSAEVVRASKDAPITVQSAN